jgi:hypothetical protein
MVIRISKKGKREDRRGCGKPSNQRQVILKSIPATQTKIFLRWLKRICYIWLVEIWSKVFDEGKVHRLCDRAFHPPISERRSCSCHYEIKFRRISARNIIQAGTYFQNYQKEINRTFRTLQCKTERRWGCVEMWMQTVGSYEQRCTPVCDNVARDSGIGMLSCLKWMEL